jgi:hypothetical protein
MRVPNTPTSSGLGPDSTALLRSASRRDNGLKSWQPDHSGLKSWQPGQYVHLGMRQRRTEDLAHGSATVGHAIPRGVHDLAVRRCRARANRDVPGAEGVPCLPECRLPAVVQAGPQLPGGDCRFYEGGCWFHEEGIAGHEMRTYPPTARVVTHAR